MKEPIIKTGQQIAIDCSPWLRMTKKDQDAKEAAEKKRWAELEDYEKVKDMHGTELDIGDKVKMGDQMGKVILWKGILMLEVKKPIDAMDVGICPIVSSWAEKIELKKKKRVKNG